MDNVKNVALKLQTALTKTKNEFSKNLFSNETETKTEYISPMTQMFAKHFKGINYETSLALSLICTLYLSVIKHGFPNDLFRKAVNFLCENTSLPAFNCNHYENLYVIISDNDNVTLPLFKDIGDICDTKLQKNEIFDAFDFLTNNF